MSGTTDQNNATTLLQGSRLLYITQDGNQSVGLNSYVDVGTNAVMGLVIFNELNDPPNQTRVSINNQGITETFANGDPEVNVSWENFYLLKQATPALRLPATPDILVVNDTFEANDNNLAKTRIARMSADASANPLVSLNIVATGETATLTQNGLTYLPTTAGTPTTRTWADIIASSGSTNTLDQVLSNGNTATGTYAEINLVNTDVGNIANPILNLQNSNATGSVAMECYKNKPTPAVNGDVLFTQSVFGKDSGNSKQEYTRINHSVRDTTAGVEDGSIEFGCFVNGAINTFLQINGNENEVNILRTLDMGGNNIRTSTGDLSILTTTSSGNGNMTISTNGSNAVGDITISAKNNMVLSCGTAPDTIDLQGGVKMTNGRQIVLTNASNSDTGYVNSQAISITDGIETGSLQKGTIYTSTATTSNTMTPTNLTINDSSTSPTIETATINATSIQFTSSGTASDSISIYNDSADGGEIEWSNVSGTNGLTITSSHSLTLKATASTYPIQFDSDVINLQNTNTTTSTANHNADIKATSNGLESTTFLKLQLNGTDIWIPYFTSDPSL
jgi:hypothetical protein